MKLKLPNWLPYADWLHLIIGLVVFFTGLGFIDKHVALALVYLFAIVNELNDKYAFAKWFLRLKNKSEKPTKFDWVDIVKTVGIPTLIYLIV